MKINHVISEQKKGVRAVKHNKKPHDPAATHAKAKEKLAPIKPMESQGVAEAFQNDESNLMYRYDSASGKLKQRMIDNHDERTAHQHGYRDSVESALRVANIIRSKFDSSKFIQNIGGKWVPVNPFGSADDVEEAQGDPIGTVQSATPDGKVAIKTDTGVVTTDKTALLPGATPQDPLQMKPDAAGDALKPGAKVVSAAEDILPPPADSQSPIHGGTVHGDEGHGDNHHNEIIQLLKRLAHRDA